MSYKHTYTSYQVSFNAMITLQSDIILPRGMCKLRKVLDVALQMHKKRVFCLW